MCRLHYWRTWATGAPGGPRQPKGPLTYSGVHHRLRTTFGDASQHACVDCGEQASDWSYNHSGIEERTGLVGAVRMLYSLDLAQYQPRCRACHNAYDRARHVDTA